MQPVYGWSGAVVHTCSMQSGGSPAEVHGTGGGGGGGSTGLSTQHVGSSHPLSGHSVASPSSGNRPLMQAYAVPVPSESPHASRRWRRRRLHGVVDAARQVVASAFRTLRGLAVLGELAADAGVRRPGAVRVAACSRRWRRRRLHGVVDAARRVVASAFRTLRGLAASGNWPLVQAYAVPEPSPLESPHVAGGGGVRRWRLHGVVDAARRSSHPLSGHSVASPPSGNWPLVQAYAVPEPSR